MDSCTFTSSFVLTSRGVPIRAPVNDAPWDEAAGWISLAVIGRPDRVSCLVAGVGKIGALKYLRRSSLLTS